MPSITSQTKAPKKKRLLLFIYSEMNFKARLNFKVKKGKKRFCIVYSEMNFFFF